MHPKPKPFAVLLAFALLVPAAPVFSQTIPPIAKSVSLDGPRVGVTFLPDGTVEKLAERSIEVGTTVSQFGWQFEKQFYNGSGVSAVTEFVVLGGGLEHGVVIPSASWLIGVRTRDGAEFGIGPNVTPAGTALVIAVGHTFRSGILNVPVNLAVIPSKSGTRITFLTGFNLRGRP
jgi:hypothetical protein